MVGGTWKVIDFSGRVCYIGAVKNANTLTPRRLNEVVRMMPTPPPTPKQWLRVDCGNIETYVGDSLIVVTLVEDLIASPLAVKVYQAKTHTTVIKYLKSEGFIGKEYYYVGFQKFQLNGVNGQE